MFISLLRETLPLNVYKCEFLLYSKLSHGVRTLLVDFLMLLYEYL